MKIARRRRTLGRLVPSLTIVSTLAIFGCEREGTPDVDAAVDAGTDADSDSDDDAGTDTDTDTGAVKPTGFLLRGTHHTALSYTSGGDPGVVWLPLPIDYATQTPLYVELDVAPASVLDGVAYSVDADGNFGATITLSADGAADDVAIHWDGVVLTRTVDDEDRPEFYAATSAPEAWTVATPVADSSYAGIAETAASLAEGATTPLEKMAAVVGWTSANITYPATSEDWAGFTGFDATSTFEWGKSSCTGFANLATALGRAIGLPTRTLVNYFVGMSQQTHYINEFYLGTDLGWRRVEPQADATVLPEEYALAVRIALVTDEGENAMTDPYLPPGIPYYSLIELLQGGERITSDVSQTGYFEDCAMCDNRAEIQAELDASDEEMAAIFDRARELWRRDLPAYVDGTLSADAMEIRRAAMEATDVGDVCAILDALER